MTEDGAAVGIDLGTTNSLLARVRDGKPEIVPVRGEEILPSVVGMAPDGELLIGGSALRQFRLYPDRTVRSVKRHMGDTGWEVALGGPARHDAAAISALILGRLREGVAAPADGTPPRAVITVPAYFGEPQRRDTMRVGRDAGLEVVRLLNEPTAAALAYSLTDRSDRLSLVYDLGGGTFDVSLVRSEGGVTEVLASHGNRRLDGDDFDDLIVDRLASAFATRTGIDLRGDAAAMARLYMAAEAAKIRLSTEGVAQVREEFIARDGQRPLHLEDEITREEFHGMIAALLDGTRRSVRQVLADAAVSARDLQEAILVGGSTHIPAVVDLVAEVTGRSPHHEIDPERVVVLGAAVQGAILDGADLDVLLVDVCAHSLGIAVRSPHEGPLAFSPVIRRNTAIPTSRSDVYYTVHPYQTVVRIEVYQGESRDLAEDVALGQFQFSGLSPAPDPDDVREVLVRFAYDASGMLRVSAEDRRTGRATALTISLDGANADAPPEALDVAGRAVWRGLKALADRSGGDGAAPEAALALLVEADRLETEQVDEWIERASALLYAQTEAY